jgi:uncharacterized membrane protein YoaK (UPF0700 family)
MSAVTIVLLQVLCAVGVWTVNRWAMRIFPRASVSLLTPVIVVAFVWGLLHCATGVATAVIVGTWALTRGLLRSMRTLLRTLRHRPHQPRAGECMNLRYNPKLGCFEHHGPCSSLHDEPDAPV